MKKETKQKAKSLADAQAEFYFTNGLIEAIEKPPCEKARPHVLAYLKFRRDVLDQQIKKCSKELVKELETIKSVYVHASNN